MITYSFFFRDSNKKSALLLCLRNRSKRIRISTGIIEEPSYFNIDKKRFTRQCPDSSFLNELLCKWDMMVSQEISVARIEGKDISYVAEKMSLLIKGESSIAKKDDTVVEFYRRWATGELKTKNPDRSNLYHYRTFAAYIGKKVVKFEDINYKFYTDFCFFLKQKGYMKNNIGSHIKDFKAVMNLAFKMGLHTNTAYKQFEKISEDVYNVYLTEEELKMIASVPLSGIMEKTRDLFLIGCYTAMRFSDYTELTVEDVKDKRFIDKKQKKTGGHVTIPIHPKVREIILRYGGAPRLSNYRLNVNIKEVCKIAGINDKVYKDGKYYEKWELVSSHTARRTGATLMYLQGIPTIAIMMITGHKSESSFKKYIKVTLQENAEMLAGARFFNEE